MGEFERKPFKVCNAQRSQVKGIVVGCLEELKSRGCEILGLDALSCRVFLECDGTEIEDSEYLSSLEQQTKLLVTDNNGGWTLAEEGTALNKSSSLTILPSFERNESLEMDDTDAMAPISEFLIKQIKRNPLYFVSFSNEQLQSVIDCDSIYLSRGLGMATHETKYYKEVCQRELDKRADMQVASDVIKLYDRSIQLQQASGSHEPEIKKPKT